MSVQLTADNSKLLESLSTVTVRLALAKVDVIWNLELN